MNNTEPPYEILEKNKSLQLLKSSQLRSFYIIYIAASGIPCPLCPKKFSSGRTLSDHHKQVHDKTNHIPCPHAPCQFTSFQPYVLKQHILKKHTKTVKYECDECSFSTYSGHKAVRMHKKKMHNGQKMSKAIFLPLILQKIKRNDLPKWPFLYYVRT